MEPGSFERRSCFASRYFASVRKIMNNTPERAAAAGSVKTHAIAMLRTVLSCSQLLFAIMVPATPDESTCVVETGNPKPSAAMMVPIATSSAAAP
jgi:hypothetical protein